MAQEIMAAALAGIKDRETLFAVLRDELYWPLNPEDTFTYPGLELSDDNVGKAQVSQIVPFTGGDPFLIMLAEFEGKFTRSALREVLRGIRQQMRSRSRYEGKSPDDIIFICATESYSAIRFARFEEREGKQPKLSSFGWETDWVDETRTLREFNLPALRMHGEPDWQQMRPNWLAAWNVERVTDEFFKTYKKVFEEVEGMIKGVTGDKRLFTQRLFNRLLFIQFLQKKRWLRFEGSTNYLPKLLAAAKARDENFYDGRLYWLFFHGLGRTMDVPSGGDDHDVIVAKRGEVPFLNGGLFEQADKNDLPGEVKIDNQAFDLILDTLFGRYNFTVTESTPLDIEVAVDPEMLGQIFEELITGRHETGSYYTPRNVVSFMCAEGIKGYLSAKVKDEPRASIEAFVDSEDASKLRNPEAVLEALKRVSVCDPACGSGAYLLGMMQELLRLRASLFTSRNLDAKTLYDRKLEIIERSLYGADKDEFAVNVAMLRLWLSLVVDDTRNPLADLTADVSLPNLKFKIQVGDSLVAPSPDASRLSLQRDAYAEHAHRLRSLHEEYFRPAHIAGDRLKKNVESDILAEQAEIANLFGSEVGDGVLDWRAAFAEVFALPTPAGTMDGRFAFSNEVSTQPSFLDIPDGGGGFDLVLANPPYVRADAQFKHIGNPTERQEAIKEWKEYRRLLLQSGTYETLYEKWDLYIPFLERAHQLLRPDGQMVFIVADSYNANKYTKRSHEFFLSKSAIERIDFCSDIPLFDAGVSNTIVHFAANEPSLAHEPVRVKRWGEKKDDFEGNAEELPTSPQRYCGRELFRLNFACSSHGADGTCPLGQICYISYGLRANADDRFWKGEFITEDLISDAKDAVHSKEFIEGKDLVRWHVRRVRYLEWGTERAPARFARPTFPELHDAEEKLIALVVATDRVPVVLDRGRRITTHTSCILVPWYRLEGVRNRSIRKTAKYRSEAKPDEGFAQWREDFEHLSRQFEIKYLLAIMTSSYAVRWLSAKRPSKNHIYPDDWKQLPIVPVPLDQQQVFVDLVDRILAEFEQHGHPLPAEAAERVSKLEREIDDRVAALYGL